jgi:hypothetical protein
MLNIPKRCILIKKCQKCSNYVFLCSIYAFYAKNSQFMLFEANYARIMFFYAKNAQFMLFEANYARIMFLMIFEANYAQFMLFNDFQGELCSKNVNLCEFALNMIS